MTMCAPASSNQPSQATREAREVFDLLRSPLAEGRISFCREFIDPDVSLTDIDAWIGMFNRENHELKARVASCEDGPSHTAVFVEVKPRSKLELKLRGLRRRVADWFEPD